MNEGGDTKENLIPSPTGKEGAQPPKGGAIEVAIPLPKTAFGTESPISKRDQEIVVENAVRHALKEVEDAEAKEEVVAEIAALKKIEGEKIEGLSTKGNDESSTPVIVDSSNGNAIKDKPRKGFIQRVGNLPGMKAAAVVLALASSNIAVAKDAAADIWGKVLEQGIKIGVDRAGQEVRIEAQRQARKAREEARAEAEKDRQSVAADRAREEQISRQNRELAQNRISVERESREIERELERIKHLPPDQRARAQERLSNRIDRLDQKQEDLIAHQKSAQQNLDSQIKLKDRLAEINQQARDAQIDIDASQQRGRANSTAIDKGIRVGGQAGIDSARGDRR